MSENAVSVAQPEENDGPVMMDESSSWEELTIQDAICQRRAHLQSMIKELDALENNLPGFVLKLKRKEFQGIYNVL